MTTNDLKKGDSVILRNGWNAEIMDMKKGNIRFCMVCGYFQEAGSVYAHDIMFYISPAGDHIPIVHTPGQLKLKKDIDGFRY